MSGKPPVADRKKTFIQRAIDFYNDGRKCKVCGQNPLALYEANNGGLYCDRCWDRLIVPYHVRHGYEAVEP